MKGDLNELVVNKCLLRLYLGREKVDFGWIGFGRKFDN